jgi:UPF0042 nucleotide-binding protein
MKLVLVTGMSGAGKGVALKALEDCGFEAIDNIPLSFLPALVQSDTRHRDLAVGADVRSRDFSADHFEQAVRKLRDHPNIDLHIVFLDCDDESLRRRFTETRRRHPLALDRPVPDGIALERQLVGKLRDIADLVLETTELEVGDLRRAVTGHFAAERQLALTVCSFSFRRGLPREADIVFDVRFLSNPYYDVSLRPLTGLNERVGQAIERDKDFASFFERMTALLVPLLPRYREEGKSYLTIAIGCTGGRHRSVYTVQKLAGFLEKEGYKVGIRHRDMESSS